MAFISNVRCFIPWAFEYEKVLLTFARYSLRGNTSTFCFFLALTTGQNVSRGPFIKGFEVDDDFAVDLGVKLDDLALLEEVQLIFTYRKWS